MKNTTGTIKQMHGTYLYGRVDPMTYAKRMPALRRNIEKVDSRPRMLQE